MIAAAGMARGTDMRAAGHQWIMSEPNFRREFEPAIFTQDSFASLVEFVETPSIRHGRHFTYGAELLVPVTPNRAAGRCAWPPALRLQPTP